MVTHPINDYYVVAYRQGERPDLWNWEIRRKSKPLGIKMIGDGFHPTRPRGLRGGKRWRIFCPNY
jgi:hypothetical protein